MSARLDAFDVPLRATEMFCVKAGQKPRADRSSLWIKFIAEQIATV